MNLIPRLLANEQILENNITYIDTSTVHTTNLHNINK